MTAERRIRRCMEGWFITEPLLFAVWTLHTLKETASIQTIRVGDHRIEFNPDFIHTLSEKELKEVVRMEAIRILLKHPYARLKPIPHLAYLASNITLQECMSTFLPFPKARDIFGTSQYDHQYYELYYDRLIENVEKSRPKSDSTTSTPASPPESAPASADAPIQSLDQPASNESSSAASEGKDSRPASSGQQTKNVGAEVQEATSSNAASKNAPAEPLPLRLEQYIHCSGAENTQPWHFDEFQMEEINERIREAERSDSWGTIAGNFRSIVLATLKPKLDYRKMLRTFRASIVCSKRTLTRMEPSRRYDFDYMGHRFGFSTRLLVAVDVSGSMSDADLQHGFSIINQIFHYGVEKIDAIQFDTCINGEAIELKKRQREIQVVGRGGTAFEPVMRYIDEHANYDGLIVFTDGDAPIPTRPNNRRTRVFWLFNSESHYNRMAKTLRHLGKGAFIRS